MKQKNFTFSKAESCFYEVYRLKRENALIDQARTYLNYELIPHHEALNLDDYHTKHRGQGIADYYTEVTGKKPRSECIPRYQSKAVGCIITIPHDYLGSGSSLSDDEQKAVIMTVYEDGVIRLNLKGEYYCTSCGAILNRQFGFNPDKGYWYCKKCDVLMTAGWTYDGERYPGVYWFCDNEKCGDCLSTQPGFNDLNDIWECTKCGYKTSITLDNIEQ